VYRVPLHNLFGLLRLDTTSKIRARIISGEIYWVVARM